MKKAAYSGESATAVAVPDQKIQNDGNTSMESAPQSTVPVLVPPTAVVPQSTVPVPVETVPVPVLEKVKPDVVVNENMAKPADDVASLKRQVVELQAQLSAKQSAASTEFVNQAKVDQFEVDQKRIQEGAEKFKSKKNLWPMPGMDDNFAISQMAQDGAKVSEQVAGKPMAMISSLTGLLQLEGELADFLLAIAEGTFANEDVRKMVAVGLKSYATSYIAKMILNEEGELLKEVAKNDLPGKATAILEGVRSQIATARTSPASIKPKPPDQAANAAKNNETNNGKPADGKPADGKPADGKPADGKTKTNWFGRKVEVKSDNSEKPKKESNYTKAVNRIKNNDLAKSLTNKFDKLAVSGRSQSQADDKAFQEKMEKVSALESSLANERAKEPQDRMRIALLETQLQRANNESGKAPEKYVKSSNDTGNPEAVKDFQTKTAEIKSQEHPMNLQNKESATESLRMTMGKVDPEAAKKFQADVQSQIANVNPQNKERFAELEKKLNEVDDARWVELRDGKGLFYMNKALQRTQRAKPLQFGGTRKKRL